MTSKEELDLMKQDPQSLLQLYMEIITTGGTLSFEQIIKLEYLRTKEKKELE